MTRLLELQMEHTQRIGEFIGRLIILGYGVVGKEWKRTPEQAALYAKQGIGSANSLHIDGLATDLALFKDGKYLTLTEQYTEAGKIWESMGGVWGGSWGKDGNHFSTAFMGRK